MNKHPLIALLAAFALGVALASAAWQYHNFGPHQSNYVVVQRYERCKAAVPEGMDCTMIAMMVSNTVAQQLGKTP